jgi:arylsulfatase A-like enzyme
MIRATFRPHCGRHPRVTHNTPFRAGKGYLYEGGLRVPLIVRGPGIVKGRVLETPFLNTDWMPTLLDLAGADVPANLDGMSQVRLLTSGKPATSERTLPSSRRSFARCSASCVPARATAASRMVVGAQWP